MVLRTASWQSWLGKAEKAPAENQLRNFELCRGYRSKRNDESNRKKTDAGRTADRSGLMGAGAD